MDVDIPAIVPTGLSPVDKLPFELLASIFIILSHGTHSHFDRNSAPWTVSKVCSKWRDISLNSPQAWSIINLTDDIRNIRNAYALLRVFLDRSQSSNLHVSVHFYSRGCEHIFQELWKSRSRWESATVRASYYMDHAWHVQGVAAEMRTLRSLELDIANIDVLKILVNAPLLQRLVLSPFLGTSFPLGTLQSLHCRPPNAAAFFKVLQEAKCLTECSFDFNEDLKGPFTPSEVTHSGIRRLSTTHALSAFDNVTLSNLEDLSVVYGHGGKDGLAPLVGLVSRSHTPLQRLELKFSFKLEEFLPLLKASPSLTSLILRRVPLSEVHPILTALTLKGNSSAVVPHLTHLTIDFHGDGTDFLDGRLLRMIHSRIEKLEAFRLMLRSILVVEVLGTRMLVSLTKERMQSEWKELCCKTLRREGRPYS
ncbi:hypothetical protein EV421DRAFT_766359 [Armillaria borealis]|uniref:F-box domain-containing protein n=1 Tax=Armillaria borealis TaxID=47425 RepID=A0AA39JGB1_9AGAR|nr:hypothetical protein EV421DRAFT_766359 [Armillaria borealis]